MPDTKTNDVETIRKSSQTGPKVLLLITKGVNGGAQTHTLALCQTLIGQVQFSVAIGGPEQASVLSEGLASLDVPVYGVSHLSNSLSPWKLLLAVRQFIQLIRLLRPDIIHAHSTAAGAIARIAGAIAHVPVIYTVHGFGFKPEVPFIQRNLVRLAELALAPLTSHMICVSNFEQQMAARLPALGRHISTIANSLPDTPERANPQPDEIKIVMVARFDAPKRQDLLIEALAVLRDQLGYELPVSLIGDGPDYDRCQAIASRLGLRSIVFAGDVNDVPKRLAEHSIFVLTSDHEGMPISIIEAMRAGLCIVASDLPGIRELVKHEETALLLPNTTTALTTALRRLVDEPALCQLLSQAARLRYATHYKPDHTAGVVMQLYKDLSCTQCAVDIK